MFWKRKKIEQAVDEAASVATHLAEKSLTIGPTGVAMLLGAAALGAAAAYIFAKRQQSAKDNKKAVD